VTSVVMHYEGSTAAISRKGDLEVAGGLNLDGASAVSAELALSTRRSVAPLLAKTSVGASRVKAPKAN